MKKMTIAAAIASAALTLAPRSADAQHMLGAGVLAAGCKQLIQGINDPNPDQSPPSSGVMLCLGAFQTFHWFVAVGELRARAPETAFCIPEDTTTEEVITAFVAYVAHKPQLAGFPAPFVIEMAMHAHWPC